MVDTQGAVNGTYSGSTFTLNSPSLLSSDADHSVAFAGGGKATAGTNYGAAARAAFSIECWVNNSIASSDAINRRFVSTESGSLAGWWLFYTASTNTISFGRTGVTITYTAATVGNTFHVVGTYDGTSLRLYINGALVTGPTTSSGTVAAQTQPFTIGLQAFNTNNPFSGRLDEVAFYPAALSATRVLAHFNAGTSNNTLMTLPASLSFAGSSNNAIVPAPMTAALSFAGSVTKAISHRLTVGALSFAGAFSKATTYLLAAALSFAGLLSKAIVRTPMAAALSFSGSIFKTIGKKAFSAALSFAGSFASARTHLIALTASLSFGGSLTRSVGKNLSAALSFAGSLTRAVVKNAFTGSLSFAGSVNRAIKKTAMTASLSFAGSFVSSRTHLISLTASLSFSGGLTKQTSKAFSAAVSFAGSLPRRVSKTLQASVGFAGGLTKSIARTLSAGLSFVGNLIAQHFTPTTPGGAEPRICDPTLATMIAYSSKSTIQSYTSAAALLKYSSNASMKLYSFPASGA